MSDVINNAREVYYRLPKDLATGTNKIVPIRGMYVTGEYKPPEYIEPVLQLLSVKTNKANIVDYVEKSVSHYSSTSHHLYDVDADDTQRIDWYTSKTAPNQVGSTTHHLFDVDADDTQRIDWYKSKSVSHYSSTTHHLFDVNSDSTFSIINKSSAIYGSQPEPILRIIEMNVSGLTVEDVT